MFKKILSIVVVLSFLYTDIVYPANSNYLTKTSFCSSRSFQRGFSALSAILEYAIKNPAVDPALFESRFNVNFKKDVTGIWITKDNWAIRLYNPLKALPFKVSSGDELIYEEDLNNIKVQVYFKGLDLEAKQAIIEYINENSSLSGLAEKVLTILLGRQTEREGPADGKGELRKGKMVRRNLLGERNEKLSRFIERLALPLNANSEVTDAIVREMDSSIDKHSKKAIKDYIEVFKRRMELKEKRDEIMRDRVGDLFIFKKISEVEDERLFTSVKKLIEGVIGRDKQLVVVHPNIMAKVVAQSEKRRPSDSDKEGLISFTNGSTIYINNDARLCDFIVFIVHEAVHLFGGEEEDSRRIDKKILSCLKGAVSLLRRIKTTDPIMNEILNSIACVLEYEVLGYELDIHAARLQCIEAGQEFLSMFSLTGINVNLHDEEYIRAVTAPFKGVIRESKDKEFFNRIEGIAKSGNNKKIDIRFFWAFMKFVRRTIEDNILEEVIEEEIEDVLEEREGPEPLFPLYEKGAFSYVIKKEEAERRLKEVVLNDKAPLFARINEAIMLDMFSEKQDIEINASELIDVIARKTKSMVKVLQILSRLRNKRSVEIISEYLNNKDALIRRIAAKSLLEMSVALLPVDIFNSPKTIDNMLSFLKKYINLRYTDENRDIDCDTFFRIITVFSVLRYKQAVPVLIDIMENNKSKEVRKYAAKSLGAIGDNSFVPEVMKRIYKEDDPFSHLLVIECLEEIPNNDTADIVGKILINTKDKEVLSASLEALRSIIEKRRISIDKIAFLVGPLMALAAKAKNASELNFTLGRLVAFSLYEGRLNIFKQVDGKIMDTWIKSLKPKSNNLKEFGMGIIHDTYINISDLARALKSNPLSRAFSLLLINEVGDWRELIVYMQRMRDNIYAGREEYNDDIWIKIAKKLSSVSPGKEFTIGRQWFQRMCLGIAYRALIDTWDVGRVEERDYILELMILRSKFVPNSELPEGSIGATEAIYGDYVVLDDSFFSTPQDVPIGLDTVRHEATHLLNAMGTEKMGDINLLGASSHSNIEFYLLSKMTNIDSAEDVVRKLKKGIQPEQILKELEGKGWPASYHETTQSVISGMGVRDKAEGPLSAFLLAREMDPEGMKTWTWEDILWRLSKINTEIIDMYTIRGENQNVQAIVHTYHEGERFGGYALRLGIDTEFYDAANIYLSLLVRHQINPAQAEFIVRTVAMFMNEEKDFIEDIKQNLIARYKGIPPGEIDKWIKRYVVKSLKKSLLIMSKEIDIRISYEELFKKVRDAYLEIKKEMHKQDTQTVILNKTEQAIRAHKRIFKAERPAKRQDAVVKTIGFVTDNNGKERPLCIYRFLDPRFIKVTIDFGSGKEEPYAYIDTEFEEVKLVNPEDSRIDIGNVIRELKLGMELKKNDEMEVPLSITGKEELKETQMSYLDRIKNINWTGLRIYGFYFGLIASVLTASFLAHEYLIGSLFIGLLTAGIGVLEFLRRKRIIYEDMEFKLNRDLEKKMNQARFVNGKIRLFIDNLSNGKLVTKKGKIFSVDDFNKMLLLYGEDEIAGFINSEFGVGTFISQRIAEGAVYIIESKEEAKIAYLNNIVMDKSIEEDIVRLAKGAYILRSHGIKFKRIGLSECFNYVKEGRDVLLANLMQAYRVKKISKMARSRAEDIADLFFNIYLLSKDKNDFIRRVINLDVLNYIKPTSTKHSYLKRFYINGEKSVTVDRKTFDAVLDALGIEKGLEFLKSLALRTSDNFELYANINDYLNYFSIGPKGYVPVMVDDARRSLMLWKVRNPNASYIEAQKEMMKLYNKYIRGGESSVSHWGWTLLWLYYFERNTPLYNAVYEMLHEVSLRDDIDIKGLADGLAAKYGLSEEEKHEFILCCPVDGILALAEIYCKDVELGGYTIEELGEVIESNIRLHLSAEDISLSDIFNGDIVERQYTFKNLPVKLQDVYKEKLRNDVIEVILSNLSECGLSDKRDEIRIKFIKFFELLFKTSMPAGGERLVEEISIINIKKILFDYGRYLIGDNAKLKALHSKKAKQAFGKARQDFTGITDKTIVLQKAITGKEAVGVSERCSGFLSEFHEEVKHVKSLVIIANNHSETIGLLYWIQIILKENPSLTVQIVPQRSVLGSDSTGEDILSAITEERKALGNLAGYLKEKRVVILENGGVKDSLCNADIVLSFGWENFISFAGLNRQCYFSFFADDPLKIALTGCNANEAVFMKSTGSITPYKIGSYNTGNYLDAVNSKVYKILLSYFGQDRDKLHEWIKLEAKRTGKKEVDIMTSKVYIKDPLSVFGKCALRDKDAELREIAINVLIDNYEKFGINKDSNALFAKLDDVEIKIGIEASCYYLPSMPCVILHKGGSYLIIELFKEDSNSYLRIGDKCYKVSGEVRLKDIMKEPVLWVGNHKLVEFFDETVTDTTRGSPGVSGKDIPQGIFSHIPQTKPSYVYERAEGFFERPLDEQELIPLELSLRLHYAIVLLSSPFMNLRMKGMTALKELMAEGDTEVKKIIEAKDLTRVVGWLESELPSVDADMFCMANFTKGQEKILRALTGGFLLRPPLVKIPGQGVSQRFHELILEYTGGLDTDIVTGDYAKGSGTVLLPDGDRHYIKEGDLLLDISKRLKDGQLIGAVRLKKEDSDIIQVPENAGFLNYFKVLHHIAHILSGYFTGRDGSQEEFTPVIEDILIIKYIQRLTGNLNDSFSDFKNELKAAKDEGAVKSIFSKYGLIYRGAGAKEDILKLTDMADFSDYISNNNLGSFNSIKEFLTIINDYMVNSVNDYINKMSENEKAILQSLLNAEDDDSINSLLIVASYMAGYYIPKINFKKDIEDILEIVRSPIEPIAQKRSDLLNDIDELLKAEDSFTKKANMIMDILLYEMGIMLGGEKRGEIERDLIELLSGRWIKDVKDLLEERLSRLGTLGISTEDIMEQINGRKDYVIGEETQKGEQKTAEPKPEYVDRIDTWNSIPEIVKRSGVKRIFCDIDKTIIDAQGYLTTTPWFGESKIEEGLEETIRFWRQLEETALANGMIHLMEDTIPDIIKDLMAQGVEVILYTARAGEDLDRTKRILTMLGVPELPIVTSKGGRPEQKRDALASFFDGKGWDNEPSLYLDDTLANVKTVCGDSRFKHIKGLWYLAHYQKRYSVLPEQYIAAGDKALEANRPKEAAEWYANAAYIMSRNNIAGIIYDIVARHVGIEASLERIFTRYVRNRSSAYKNVVAKRREIEAPEKLEQEKTDKKTDKWIEGAPPVINKDLLDGIKRVIVIGSHPHGDHIKGFLDYAKRRMKNLVETVPPLPGERLTGGPITHSLSNYWGRLGDETIVLFDLGWFPEGFTDPLIETINPREREIVFVMDPSTERAMDFKRQVKKLKTDNVKLEVLDYNERLNISVENGKILQIENYPAYHLEPDVGSSIYMTRIIDSATGQDLQSVGYISELGDDFPETVNSELLDKLARLDRIIVDGTNLITPEGEGPLPTKGRPNKIYEYIANLNAGKYLISHFNTTSIRMGEEARVVAEKLDSGIPIVVIGGKEPILQLKRIYNVPEGRDFYMLGDKRVYLVSDIAEFHKRFMEEGVIPKLKNVIGMRVKELRQAGWTNAEIQNFVREWEKRDKEEIQEYEGPKGKVKEIERLLWDLRKTKAVVISSSQFRGDPGKEKYQNFKGFQILDAIVDKKDVNILIEGRLHTEGEEGVTLNVLLGKQKNPKLQSITGEKQVRAYVDNQWRSGHITFDSLMYLLNLMADKAEKIGNVYKKRTYLPVPKKEWLALIPRSEARHILKKYGQDNSNDIIDIINRWNNRRDVTGDEMGFTKKVLKRIFRDERFWKEHFKTTGSQDLRKDFLTGLDSIDKDVKFKGRANINVFIASTSKFADVLAGISAINSGKREGRFRMDPRHLRDLFRIVMRFVGVQTGISYEYGKTLDLAKRNIQIHSRDFKKGLAREYLVGLYNETSKGKVPSDLSSYRTKKPSEQYAEDLKELLEKANKKAKRRKMELFPVWFGELKRYIGSQYLRIGMRHADKTAMYSELRNELSEFYDALITHVYNFLQEDLKWKYKDITITAGGDYAQGKILFANTLWLGISAGRDVNEKYIERFASRMKGILKKMGVFIEFADLEKFAYRRPIVSGAVPVENKIEKRQNNEFLKKREKRLKKDAELLNKWGDINLNDIDMYQFPGTLSDINLVRCFFDVDLTAEEKTILDDAEEFFRRFKEEIGFSTGGDGAKREKLLGEILTNIAYKGREDEFQHDLCEKAYCVYMILLKYMGNGEKESQPAPKEGKAIKNISFGPVDEETDLHKGFEKAAAEGRLFTKETVNTVSDPILKAKLLSSFFLIDDMIREIGNGAVDLKGRKFKIVVERPGEPTIVYKDDPFTSVLSHSGKRTKTIYFGLNTLMLAGKPVHREALKALLLHENRDIQRGYHMDLEDEVREGFITHRQIDSIYNLWNDLITRGRFGVMYNLYIKRARKKKFEDYFLKNIPANIRLKKEGNVLYKFKHGDAENLPDLIELDLELFGEGFSPATQVFVLRHCSDKIRYDRSQTIVNDVKYLARLSRRERNTILSELKDHGYTDMIRRALRISKLKLDLNKEAKEMIHEYVKLRIEPHRTPDGADICYTVGGNLESKTTLVFLHGLGVESKDWRFQISFFERNCKIVTIDLRGFGKSKGLGTKPPDIKNYSEDVDGILAREKITNAYLVGHSMGGMVALNMEEIYGDVSEDKRRIKGLVLISTVAGDPTRSFFSPRLKKIGPDQVLRYMLFYFSQFDAVWNHPLFKRLSKWGPISLAASYIAQRWITPPEINPTYTRKVIRSVFKNDLEDLIYALRAIMTNNVEERLKDIKIPVMWMIGEDDKIVLAEEQEKDARKIKDCSIMRFKGVKHYLHATYPRRANKAINRFINTGVHRFSQLVCESIKKEYLVDVSLDALESNINSLKMRLVPRLKGIKQDDLRLRFINNISETVTRYGLQTGASNELMVKAVLIIASQIIPEMTRPEDFAQPIRLKELEEQYQYVVKSV